MSGWLRYPSRLSCGDTRPVVRLGSVDAQLRARVAAGIGLVVSAFATASCGGDTPARAVYAVAHDLEHGVIDGACERIYPTRLLPVQVSAALGLPASRDGEGSSWDDERDACARRLRAPDEVNALGFREPRVHSVSDVPVTLRGDISAAAQARVAFDGAEPTLVRLVEFRGQWRVVMTS